MTTSDAQREMLVAAIQRETDGKTAHWFAPNSSVARALARRGLATVHYVGGRWWKIQLTRAGRDLARSLIPEGCS